jgi:hypothetical protein
VSFIPNFYYNNRPFYLAVVGIEVEVTNGFSAKAMKMNEAEAFQPDAVVLHLKPFDLKNHKCII